MRRIILSLVLLSALSACGAPSTWAPDEAVQAARYEHPGPKAVTLFTVINNKNGAGAHSGLMINASQRMMFDPAGSWTLPRLAERNDVHFGMTDKMVNFYIDYHARETYRVVEQTVEVPASVAESMMQKALAYGAVPKAQCTTSISRILKGEPGFTSVSQSAFPLSLMRDFAAIPGVKTRVITDDDTDDNHGILLVQTKGDLATPEEVAQARVEKARKHGGAVTLPLPTTVAPAAP